MVPAPRAPALPTHLQCTPGLCRLWHKHLRLRIRNPPRGLSREGQNQRCSAKSANPSCFDCEVLRIGCIHCATCVAANTSHSWLGGSTASSAWCGTTQTCVLKPPYEKRAWRGHPPTTCMPSNTSAPTQHTPMHVWHAWPGPSTQIPPSRGHHVAQKEPTPPSPRTHVSSPHIHHKAEPCLRGNLYTQGATAQHAPSRIGAMPQVGRPRDRRSNC